MNFLHYRIEKELGGNMANVYRAYDTENGCYVALKRILNIQDNEDKIKAEETGARQQEIMCVIDSHVPRVYEYGSEDGYFYVAMEYIEGEDLSRKIRSSKIPIEIAASYAIEICKLVESGKRQNIIHGDLKPGNIRITPAGEVKVLDFGIAKSLSGTRSSTGNPFRSAAYSSPERIKDMKMSVDSDLWAIAVMLFEMISGDRPFPGAKTDEDFERAIRRYSALNQLRSLPGDCPDPLKLILEKALSPRLSDRYSAPEKFRADLENFLAGKKTEAEVEYDQVINAPTKPTSQPLVNPPPTRPFTQPINVSTQSGREPVAPDPPTRPTPRQPPPVRQTEPVSKEKKVEQGFSREDRQWEKKIPPQVIPFKYKQAGSRRWLIIGVVAVVLALAAINEYSIANGIKALEPEIEGATTLAAFENSYATYRNMANRSLLARMKLLPGLNSLKSKLVASANREIDRYRASELSRPVVMKENWQHAALCLRWASELGRDTECEARLNYCEGHVLRIGNKNLEAVRKFEMAAQLKPNWPDPHIGLARIYRYDLREPEKSLEEIGKAMSLGYPRDRHTIALEADNHWMLSEKFFLAARAQRGQPEEESQLSKAREHCQRAIDNYNTIISFANARANRNNAQNVCNRVDSRMSEISAAEQQEQD